MSAPSIPVSAWIMAGSRGSWDVTLNPRTRVKNEIDRSMSDTVKLV